jgi:hypothetical protein
VSLVEAGQALTSDVALTCITESAGEPGIGGRLQRNPQPDGGEARRPYISIVLRGQQTVAERCILLDPQSPFPPTIRRPHHAMHRVVGSDAEADRVAHDRAQEADSPAGGTLAAAHIR